VDREETAKRIEMPFGDPTRVGKWLNTSHSLHFCSVFLLKTIHIYVQCSGNVASFQITMMSCFCRFWFFKILIIVGVIIGAFFIKDPTFDKGKFSTVILVSVCSLI